MISFSNINKQYGKQLLFVDASFQLNPREKVGLVGPNGAGKTTLFRIVVGEATPDEGAVSVPKKLTIGYFRRAGPAFPPSTLFTLRLPRSPRLSEGEDFCGVR
jgi:ATPase subunit of ABC transporter with duplicated ATPase domains